jgi:glycosyltransferase involved in cell wall biosynthesis
MVKYRLASAGKVVSLKYEYGVDLSRYNPDSIDRIRLEEMRRKLGLEEGTPVIGFSGRMIGAKGILDLFEAYQIIRAGGIRAKLLYLGDVLTTDKDSATYEHLKNLVREKNCGDDVIFLGYQNDVPFYLSLMDVVVLPSYHEGFPRVPVEAGAMAKPSVCTAVSGADVAIEQGKTGFIVPIRNPKRLAEAITTLITNPTLAREMGMTARQRALDLFDQNKIVDQQIRIYEEFFEKREQKHAGKEKS